LNEVSRKRVKLAVWICVGCVALLAGLRLLLVPRETPSNIVEFHPTQFSGKAEAPFFYSVGDDLKNSNTIDQNALTLLHGHIKNFLVSPDGAKIAVVANGSLMVLGRSPGTVQKIASADSIYREPKPLGQTFFRDDDFQWSKDSKNLYLVKDEYYTSKGSQLYSDKGELWMYNVEKGQLELVLKPFPAYSYFFGLGSGIYFSVPTVAGDLQLKYFDGDAIRDVPAPNTWGILVVTLNPKFHEQPFMSLSLFDYEKIALSAHGIWLHVDEKSGFEVLDIEHKNILALTRGQGFKGSYYCSDLLRSVFLPGDRYFLMNVPYCGNYDGQLLIDSLSGSYQVLPHDTRVYVTLNTDNDPDYRVTVGGILAR
jgi:hypothetical protein